MVFIEDPRSWPLCDVLPLRRDITARWPELGVMVAGEGPVVFLTNAFIPGLTRRLTTCEKIEYASFEAVRAAGWVVD